MRESEVARGPWTSVGFKIVVHCQPVRKCIYHIFAQHRRTIFHHNYLEVIPLLRHQTFEQIPHLIRPVVYRDNYRIFECGHRNSLLVFRLLIFGLGFGG